MSRRRSNYRLIVRIVHEKEWFRKLRMWLKKCHGVSKKMCLQCVEEEDVCCDGDNGTDKTAEVPQEDSSQLGPGRSPNGRQSE